MSIGSGDIDPSQFPGGGSPARHPAAPVNLLNQITFNRRELNRMDAWLHSNPKKRPTHRGAVRFVNSWLTKAIDKAARNGARAFQAARVIDGGVAGRAAARLRAIEGNADGGSLRNDVSDIIAIGPYLSGQFSVAEDR